MHKQKIESLGIFEYVRGAQRFFKHSLMSQQFRF